MTNTHSPTLRSRLRDQLGNGDPKRVATAAFAVVDALQSREELLPGEYLGAIVAACILSLEASGGLPSSDAFALTRNLMADADGRRPEFRAITEYLSQEVMGV